MDRDDHFLESLERDQNRIVRSLRHGVAHSSGAASQVVYSVAIAEHLGVSDDALRKIRWAAELHDAPRESWDRYEFLDPVRLLLEEVRGGADLSREGKCLVAGRAAGLAFSEDPFEESWLLNQGFDPEIAEAIRHVSPLIQPIFRA